MLLPLTLAFSLLALIGVVVLLFRPAPGQAALERALRSELQAAREEQGRLSSFRLPISEPVCVRMVTRSGPVVLP